MITGANIKDSTIRSVDVADGSLRVSDLAPTARSALAPAVYSKSDPSDTLLTGDFATLLALKVPPGNYVVSVSGTLFEVDPTASAMGQCRHRRATV